MSYNTRRTGNPRVGPQVNYHQSQQGMQQRQQGGRSMGSQNSGYNTSNSYNQSGYNTQSGYNSVQSGKQGQQQSQSPTPQSAPPVQQPPAPPAQQQPPAQSNPTPPQNEPTPAAAAAAANVPPANTVKDTDSESTNETAAETNGDEKKKPYWLKKGAAFKVSKKIKRRRQNARLRKLLLPKNALMILHELHPEMKCTIQEQLNALNQTVFTTIVTVEGKQYHGQAMSKNGAKQIACENALKSILLDKMGKPVHDADAEPMDMLDGSSIAHETVKVESESGDDPMEGGEKKQKTKSAPEDNVPWGSLASFALHKLFVEWQSQGIQVPMAAPRAAPPVPPAPVKPVPVAVPPTQTPGSSPRPMKKIPEDAAKRHPVQLLNQLRPGSLYSEQCSGIVPNLTFTVSVLIDGEEFVGVAGNKKDAKRDCAKAALIKMGIVYDK